MANNIIACTKCNKSVDFDFYKSHSPIINLMREKKLCFDCAFWTNWMSHKQPDHFIVSGALYKMVFIQKPSFYQKKKDNILFMRNMQTGEACCSVQYMVIGRIPDCFKNELSDQFKIISKDTYEKIKDYQGACCMRKGCFDRYECLWYNSEIAEPDGPWNVIPESHKTGEEMCESFIDKNKMYDCF